MKYLMLFEAFKRKLPKFKKVKLEKGRKVLYNKKLSHFNKEDIKNIYDEFSIISQEYKIKLVKKLDSDKEINQYIIGSARNAFIDIYMFDNIELIEDELKSFINGMKNKFQWDLVTDQSFSVESKLNSNDIEYLNISIVFGKENN